MSPQASLLAAALPEQPGCTAREQLIGYETQRKGAQDIREVTSHSHSHSKRRVFLKLKKSRSSWDN